MITLTFTEAVFWAMFFSSIPFAYFFYLQIDSLTSWKQKAELRIERISDFTDELSERLYKIEELNEKDND